MAVIPPGDYLVQEDLSLRVECGPSVPFRQERGDEGQLNAGKLTLQGEAIGRPRRARLCVLDHPVYPFEIEDPAITERAMVRERRSPIAAFENHDRGPTHVSLHR